MTTAHRPLPPVPAPPPANSGGQSTIPILDQRWLSHLRSRLNSSLTALLIHTSNGFSGTTSLDPSTGQSTATLSVTVSGVLKGFEGALTTAVPGTDYIQSLSVTPPLATTGGGTPTLSIPAATPFSPGHLTAPDHALFTSKAPGHALQVRAVASGFIEAIPDGCTHFYLQSAAPLATGALALPSEPADAAIVTIFSPYDVTALTNIPVSGQSIIGWPALLPASTAITFIYRASNSTWYRFS